MVEWLTHPFPICGVKKLIIITNSNYLYLVPYTCFKLPLASRHLLVYKFVWGWFVEQKLVPDALGVTKIITIIVEILPWKFDAERRANFCLPRFFSSKEKNKIPQIPKSGITHMVTSNGGHPLHHHLRLSGRLSNSLFNRRTTKFQTFTLWPQASAL